MHITEWQELAMDRERMKNATKKLYGSLVESEYEEESDSDRDSDESSLLSSTFAGFSDEETQNMGFEEESDQQ